MPNGVEQKHETNMELDPPPGVLRWLISCDESGTDGSRYYGFGALWMNWQRRGDFANLVNKLRAKHQYHAEIKWNAVGPRYLNFFRDLIEEFFRTKWLFFHCIVIEKAIIRKELHGGDLDLARRKQFTKLLTNKIARCLKVHKDREQTFRIWVDPIASRYKKADEALEIIANNALRQTFGLIRPVDKVLTRDSKSTPAIQLCDLMLGAVLAAWQQKATAPAKLDIQAWIACHLGWEDLRSDTHPSERKFNVWYFYDKSHGPRDISTRRVNLLYPLKIETK